MAAAVILLAGALVYEGYSGVLPVDKLGRPLDPTTGERISTNKARALAQHLAQHPGEEECGENGNPLYGTAASAGVAGSRSGGGGAAEGLPVYAAQEKRAMRLPTYDQTASSHSSSSAASDSSSAESASRQAAAHATKSTSRRKKLKLFGRKKNKDTSIVPS